MLLCEVCPETQKKPIPAVCSSETD